MQSDNLKAENISVPPTAVVPALSSAPAPTIETMGPYKVDTAWDCDGYLRINVSVLDGYCVGLVATNQTPASDNNKSLSFPRDILIPKDTHRLDKEVLIVDMGGWGEERGRLMILNQGQVSTAVSDLNLPHSIEYGLDGAIYIGRSRSNFAPVSTLEAG